MIQVVRELPLVKTAQPVKKRALSLVSRSRSALAKMAEVETSEKIEKSSILLAVSFFDSHGKVITRNNLCRCDISQSFEVLCEQSAVKFNVDLRQCEKSPGRLVSDSVKCHVSPTLDNKDFFAVDISETIRSVLELTVVKSVKYSIDENTSDDEHPVECDTDTDSHLASGSGGTSDKPSNVFKLMMSKRSKCPQTVPELNKKDQLHNSFVREHASGMKFPGDMEQSVINYNVRLITNCLWYMDGRKQLLKDRKESSKKITEVKN